MKLVPVSRPLVCPALAPAACGQSRGIRSHGERKEPMRAVSGPSLPFQREHAYLQCNICKQNLSSVCVGFRFIPFSVAERQNLLNLCTYLASGGRAVCRLQCFPTPRSLVHFT